MLENSAKNCGKENKSSTVVCNKRTFSNVFECKSIWYKTSDWIPRALESIFKYNNKLLHVVCCESLLLTIAGSLFAIYFELFSIEHSLLFHPSRRKQLQKVFKFIFIPENKINQSKWILNL